MGHKHGVLEYDFAEDIEFFGGVRGDRRKVHEYVPTSVGNATGAPVLVGCPFIY